MFRVLHRLDEALEPLTTTNCDDISRERSCVHRKCFDKVLDTLVRYYARFVIESWSKRKNERERERLKEEKRKKKSCPLFSLFFFFLLSFSLFLSFFPKKRKNKKMRRRDFWFFWPLCWKKKRAGSYRRIKENYNIFARTETSKRKRKEQKTSDVEKRRVFVRFVGSYATCATLTRRQSSFCVDKIFCIFCGREERKTRNQEKRALSPPFSSLLSLF